MKFLIAALAALLIAGCEDPGKSVSIGVDMRTHIPAYAVYTLGPGHRVTRIKKSYGKGASAAAACFAVVVNGEWATNNGTYGDLAVEGFGECECIINDDSHSCRAEMFLRPWNEEDLHARRK